MSFYIHSDYGKLPKEVQKGYKKPTTEMLRYLQSKKVKPVTPLSRLEQIARVESKRTGVPIKITKYLGTLKKGTGKNVEGTATLYDKGAKKGQVLVRMHPALQYRTEKHFKSLLAHELEHVRVYKTWKKYKKK